MNTQQERLAWIELALTPYIGAETFLALLKYFGSATAVLAAPVQEVRPLLKHAQAIKHWHGDSGKQAAEQALNWEQQHTDARLLLLQDADFPVMLSEGLTPPPLLFTRGDVSYLQQPSLAIVGSRHATPQAMRIAGEFAAALAERGNIVVSGMADGIDTAAHEGALRHQGATVAIWGTGIDRVYPARNKALAIRIAEEGCIVSEFPLGTRPLAHHFPRRNRLIAALTQGTLVVEAALASGSLITARLAGEMGRDVFAVPGSIDNPLSKGCHELIRQGAKLVEKIEDILQENTTLLQKRNMQAYRQPILECASSAHSMPISTPANSPAPESQPPASITPAVAEKLDKDHQIILDTIGYGIIHPDTIAMMLGMNTTDVYAHLMTLELNGWITLVPGGCYQRIKS